VITERHLSIATKLTKYSDVKKGRVSAIAFNNNGKILTTAQNRKLIGHGERYSTHAEENLIRKLLKINAFQRYGRITVLVLRLSSEGVTMARPCKRCQSLIDDYPIDIIYTSWSGELEKFRHA
jgi:cytidine deaminase